MILIVSFTDMRNEYRDLLSRGFPKFSFKERNNQALNVYNGGSGKGRRPGDIKEKTVK
jgi:hypothetical protein